MSKGQRSEVKETEKKQNKHKHKALHIPFLALIYNCMSVTRVCPAAVSQTRTHTYTCVFEDICVLAYFFVSICVRLIFCSNKNLHT